VGRSCRLTLGMFLSAMAFGSFVIGTAGPASAAAGDLDPTFGGDGTVTTDFTDSYDAAFGIGVQSDGKIVVVGETASDSSSPKFAVARYNTDGALDDSFSKNGKRHTDFTDAEDFAFGMAIQPDGKIVAAGTAAADTAHPKFAVARYNADGSTDETFSADGKRTLKLSSKGDLGLAMALQANGKIILVGDAAINGRHSTFGVARLNANGSLDQSFGGDGIVKTDVGRNGEDGLAVAISPDGNIVVAGGDGFNSPNERFALVRYESDGSPDPSFGGDGIVKTDFTPRPDVAFSVTVQSDGKIVAAGGSNLGPQNPKWALTRYDTDGSLDHTFGGDGKVTTDFSPGDDDIYQVVTQPNGKLVAVGQSGGDDTMFGVARYNRNGSLDPSFGNDGQVTTNFTPRYDSAFPVAIQPDGKIVVAGQAGVNGFANFGLARYEAA